MINNYKLDDLAPQKLGVQTIASDFLSAQAVVSALNTINSELSISGSKQPGKFGILSTYIIKQNNEDILSIDIPVDKVIDSAKVIKFDTDQAAKQATGDINAKAGTYIEIKIQNVTDSKYVPVPTLVNTYEGISSTTIKTVANEIYDSETSSYSYKISADINDNSVDQKHLTTGLSGEISGKTDITSVKSLIRDTMAPYLSTYTDIKSVPISNMMYALSALYELI